VAGDIVQVQYVGYYYKNGGKKKKEFDDTYHQVKMKKFTIGARDNPAIPVGLERAVKDMQFGETARVELSANVAYGIKGHTGYVGPVPPDQDVVFDSFGLVKLQRGNTFHSRVPVNNAVQTGCCGYGY
jgi:FKBP-type peptidyl-prolyl cis-trans isomerase